MCAFNARFEWRFRVQSWLRTQFMCLQALALVWLSGLTCMSCTSLLSRFYIASLIHQRTSHHTYFPKRILSGYHPITASVAMTKLMSQQKRVESLCSGSVVSWLYLNTNTTTIRTAVKTADANRNFVDRLRVSLLDKGTMILHTYVSEHLGRTSRTPILTHLTQAYTWFRKHFHQS